MPFNNTFTLKYETNLPEEMNEIPFVSFLPKQYRNNYSCIACNYLFCVLNCLKKFNVSIKRLEKELMCLDKSLWEFFFFWGGGGWGGTVVILLNMGYYTLYEGSYILEIQIEN